MSSNSRIDESGHIPGDPNLESASGSDSRHGNLQETTFNLDGHAVQAIMEFSKF